MVTGKYRILQQFFCLCYHLFMARGENTPAISDEILYGSLSRQGLVTDETAHLLPEWSVDADGIETATYPVLEVSQPGDEGFNEGIEKIAGLFPEEPYWDVNGGEGYWEIRVIHAEQVHLFPLQVTGSA